MITTLPPQSVFPIVNKEGLMVQQFMLFLNDIALTNILSGVGTPEGTVSAIQGQEYMDTTGTAGAIKYIKRDDDIGGDSTKGWILI